MRGWRETDLRWSSSGDLCLDAKGDLEDTANIPLGSFIQEVRTRIQSDLYDWALNPHIGSSLSELVGEPNNKETAENGKIRIISCLTKDGLCDSSRIKVRYTPISRHVIMYNVLIQLPDITGQDLINISLLFNQSDFEIVFL